MKKIYTYVAGKTMNSHEKFVKKLKKRGAKVVESPEKSDATIVFCPIVSRFESDIDSALSSISDLGCRNVILVGMHHTHDPMYILPNCRDLGNRAVTLYVDCLFYEDKGLLRCPRNQKAVKAVLKEMGLGEHTASCVKN